MTDPRPQQVVTISGDTSESVAIVAISSMPLDDREDLLRRLRSALSSRRLGERGQAIRAVAKEDCAGIVRATDLAHEVHRRLIRYASTGWRFEQGRPAPEDPARARMHLVLTLQNGDVPSFSTIWRALAG